MRVTKMELSMQDQDEHKRRATDKSAIAKIAFSPVFNFSHVLTTVGILITLFSYVSELDKNIALNTQEIQQIKESEREHNRQIAEDIKEIKGDIKMLVAREMK